MSYLNAIFICAILGLVNGSETEIDINRVKLLPNENQQDKVIKYERQKLAEQTGPLKRDNDYINRSNKLLYPLPSMHAIHHPTTKSDDHTLGTVHPPREDPRLFYQSNAYIEEINQMHLRPEVSEIYPGREVMKAGEMQSWPFMQKLRAKTQAKNICIKCPHDTMLIAKPGADHVVLQTPRLWSCGVHPLPQGVHFVQAYGPKFGSLLTQGSHIVLGRVIYENKTLQMCKMQIHVMTQNCPLPKYLSATCDDHKICNFTCRKPKMEFKGTKSLRCGDDLKWEGILPTCKARSWCEQPAPPKHGGISCSGSAAGPSGIGLRDGSKCKLRCAKSKRGKIVAICRRGTWTHKLKCETRKKILHTGIKNNI